MVSFARFFVARCATSLGLLLSVALVVFTATALMPRHPEANLLGPTASEESIRELRRSLGLEDSLPQQFWDWLSGLPRGDFGRSWSNSQAVAEQLGPALTRTVSLFVVAFAVAALAGVAAGLVAGTKPNGVLDRVISTVTAALQAVPEFWLSLMLISAFAVMLRWFPGSGYVDIAVSPADWIHSITLPALALGLPIAASICRHVRSAVILELTRDYVRTAVIQGFSRGWILRTLVLRNSLPSVITILGLQALILISVSVIVENIFAIRGIGTLIVNALSEQDTPMLLGGVVVFTALVVLISLAAEILRVVSDPTTRGRAL
ncbi:ABC transporter permease [Nocardioides sp. L-11A]|uniref:ABC transporter permease n=1 Tax=Nocardioides sp. L-11A TaxID=3043848 RepID=UPI00249CBE90|nr:ABC transporter permease [Nocardioides sp. L-11A]